jgi:hypothetical protein
VKPSKPSSEQAERFEQAEEYERCVEALVNCLRLLAKLPIGDRNRVIASLCEFYGVEL